MIRLLADCRVLAALAFFVGLVLVQTSAALALEDVGLRGGRHPDFGRLVFDWPSPVPYQAEARGQELVVTFDRPARFNTARALANLRGYLDEARASSDGRSLHVTMTGDFQIKHFALSERVVIDFLGGPRKPSAKAAGQSTEKPAAKAGNPSPKTLQDAAKQATADQIEAKREEATKTAPRAGPQVAASPQAATPSPGRLQSLVDPREALHADAAPGSQDRAGRPATAGRPVAPISLLPPALEQVRRKPDPQASEQVKTTPRSPAVDSAVAGAAQTAPKPSVKPNTVAQSAAAPGDDPTAGAAAAVPNDGLGRMVVLPAPLWLEGQEAAPGVHALQRPLTMRFTWGEPTRAAAFRYGGDVWLVFDRPLAARALEASMSEDLGLRHVRQLDDPDATVIRLGMAADVAPRLTAEDGGWLVDIRRRSALPESIIEADLAADGDQAVIRFAITGSGRIQWIKDPDTNERLAVVPVSKQGAGVARSHRYPQFFALPSQQGVALLPVSDSLEVAAARSGVLVRDRNGLIVSSGASRSTLPLDPLAARAGHRLFNLPDWRGPADEAFLERKHALMQKTIKAPSGDAVIPHLQLARFYFSWGLAIETLGLLEVVENEAPHFTEDPQLLLMRGVSAFLLEDYDSAAEVIAHPALDGEWEALLWQAALAAVSQDWQAAASAFALSDRLVGAYPPRVANRLRLLAAEARLGIGDSGGASEYLIALTRGELSANEEASTKYLLGRRFFLDEDYVLAERMWREIEDHTYGPARVRARLGLLELALAEGKLDRAAITEKLERLRFAWRGDQFELTILLRLGELYGEDRNYEEALRIYRFAASHYPDSARAAGVTGRMREIFAKIFLDEEATPVPPLKALAIYEHFRELTPAGLEGERVIERLADRLVEVDLLGKAAQLLEDQVRYRLEGEDKARVGARLAVVRLLDLQAPGALRALDDTRVSPINQELTEQRLHLRARAMAQIGRKAEALALLDDNATAAGVELRAEIQWEMANWSAAADSLRQLVPHEPPKEPVGERTARILLNLAIALTLADDRVKLIDLNKRYGDHMAATPQGEVFALLANDIDSSGFRTIAEGLGQLNEAQAFMSGYREMVESGRLSALN